MMHKGLIIIPVYNEESNIEQVVAEVRETIDFADILIINDGSTDSTRQIVKELNVKSMTLPFNMGYSVALQTGFKYAVEKNYDFIIQYDGDGQHVAKEVIKLYQIFKLEGADIVIGSRFKSKKKVKQTPFRRLGSKIFSLLIRNICGISITDPTSGFQLLRRTVFKRYAGMYHFPKYPDANLIIEMLLNDFKIMEVDVEMRERISGKSMHSGIVNPTKYMIKVVYSIILIVINYKFLHMFRKRRKK
jgi:glycosyltransferase involved in cell wall biosynthesis